MFNCLTRAHYLLSRQLWLVVNPPLLVRWFWLAIALIIGIGYGIAALPDFSVQYLIPDDGRQHLFWTARFLDPDLFPGDRIADYFQSVAPWGFQSIYRLGALFNLAPWDIAKWIPIPLSLATAWGAFLVGETWLPLPAANALTSILLLQNLWLRDDLASGTARAFLNPLFLLVLLGIQRRSPQLVIPAILILGGFYPHYVLITGVILGLELLRQLIWDKKRFNLWSLELGGAIACILVLLPFAINASEFGPTISRAIAQTLPEFLPDGRTRFFYDDFGRFWLSGGRSGIQIPLNPPLYCFGLLLPILYRWKHKFPLLQQVSSNVNLLNRLTLASFITFFTAHLLLFRLHLPSRYTQHSLRIVLASAAAIALFALLDVLWNRLNAIAGKLIAIALVAFALLYPLTYKNFPKTNYVTGDRPDLYAYLQTQPKTIRIASLSGIANNLPTFAQRTVLTGAEYAIPYHWGYYEPFRQTTLDLITAQYTPDPTVLAQAIATHGITHWLIDRNAFTPDYFENQKWLRQYEPAFAIARESPSSSYLATQLETCKTFETPELYVLDANCLVKAP